MENEYYDDYDDIFELEEINEYGEFIHYYTRLNTLKSLFVSVDILLNDEFDDYDSDEEDDLLDPV